VVRAAVVVEVVVDNGNAGADGAAVVGVDV
jgi:hypothetical protein